ncbi:MULTISPECIES: hypothetical protein [unclassified Arthrobacter]|uniref:hypothetical protein n=1 Tax=unclassified Arthrobacter TaxID=235627 RepID=UPI00149220DC|nr:MULTISPECIES: hypothetical protein [unclassified Arthrobacter]NOJ63326.1 hypothetical protein [Arthrobacter sp. 147(2020)]
MESITHRSIDIGLTDLEIGQNIAVLRGTRSQKTIADGMKPFGFRWTQTTVWEVESGKRSLKAKEAKALAAVLNTRVQNLFGETVVTQTRAVVLRSMHKIQSLEIAAAEAVEQYALARTKSLALADEVLLELEESGVDHDEMLTYLAQTLRRISSKSLEEVMDERADAIREAKKMFGEDATLRFHPGVREIVEGDDGPNDLQDMLLEDEANGIDPEAS